MELYTPGMADLFYKELVSKYLSPSWRPMVSIPHSFIYEFIFQPLLYKYKNHSEVVGHRWPTGCSMLTPGLQDPETNNSSSQFHS